MADCAVGVVTELGRRANAHIWQRVRITPPPSRPRITLRRELAAWQYGPWADLPFPGPSAGGGRGITPGPAKGDRHSQVRRSASPTAGPRTPALSPPPAPRLALLSP